MVPRFTAAVLAVIERDRCTVIDGVPTMLHVLAGAGHPDHDTSALRVACPAARRWPKTS